jgi:histidinol phosphatase-like enzyme
VARGLFDENAVRAVNALMEDLLRAQNPQAIIDRQEYCPYHPRGLIAAYCRESDLRKPSPGMILRAAREKDLDLSCSWVIGDAPRDIAAGHAAGCRTILFQPPSLSRSPAADETSAVRPQFIARSLAEAMEIVKRET